MQDPVIKLIQPQDNKAVRRLVLDTLSEFGLTGPGYAGVDAELEDMYASYSNELSAYYVVVLDGEILGVGGYAPLLGTEPGTIAELRKMYLTPALRGKGMGQKLIDICLAETKAKGYGILYLETVPAMKAAQGLYLKNGFQYLKQRLGDTGHSNCGIHMQKVLND
ncbi:MAG: GNAT family N-acetyltransferase [Marinicella sp.]